jgi:hypothetical protein
MEAAVHSCDLTSSRQLKAECYPFNFSFCNIMHLT